MFLFWGVILGLLVGFARKGRFGNLATVQLRAIWLVLIGIVLQFLIFPTPWTTPPIKSNIEILHGVSYLLLGVFFISNMHVRELWGMALGMGLNAVVIAANKGFMPASADALDAAGRNSISILLRTPPHTHANIVLMNDSTELNILGDWMYIPAWVPFANAFSIGDLVLIGSLAWLIQRQMRLDSA